MFLLHAHLVFVIRYRHPVFTARHLERMEEIIRDVCRDFECELAEFNGEASHVHLLVRFPPEGRPVLACQQPQGRVLATAAPGVPGPAPSPLAGEPAAYGSYFAGSVGGAPVTVLRQYIEQQDGPA